MSAPLFHMLKEAPKPVAPFSHAVEIDGWVFVTGQLPLGAADENEAIPERIEEQTTTVFENLSIVLQGVGLDLSHVVSARVFLTHFERDYERMNAIYATYFPPDRRPGRTCVGVTALARGCLVEIDLVARRPSI
jgi:2-iminobutanoate/2-iminopropanoate deaminase